MSELAFIEPKKPSEQAVEPQPQKAEVVASEPVAEVVNDQVVVTPSGLDPEHLMLADVDTSVRPLFSVKEVGKIFFGKSDHWMRLREQGLTYDGTPIEVARSQYSARQYDLATVEKIAHGLAQNHRISGQHAALILVALNAIAKIYGYLPSDD